MELVHRDDAKDLQTLGASLRLADDPRALMRRLEAAAPQGRHMQQHVACAAVGHDEAVALRYVEPFYRARDLEELDGAFIAFRDCGS